MPRKHRQQHGLHALKRRLRVQGLAALDKRSATFRRAMSWRAGIEGQLNGRLTATRHTLLDTAVALHVTLDYGYQWLFAQLEDKGGLALVNGRRRSLYPVVLQLAQLGDSLARIMVQLGLDPAQASNDESEQAIVELVKRDLKRARRRPGRPKKSSNLTQDEPEATGVADESSSTAIAQPGQDVEAMAGT